MLRIHVTAEAVCFPKAPEGRAKVWKATLCKIGVRYPQLHTPQSSQGSVFHRVSCYGASF